MPKRINEHYVPQFYLRGFSKDRIQLYFFDKATRHSYLSNVRNIASEGGFYDFAEEANNAFIGAVERGDFAHEDPMVLAMAKNRRLIDDELTKFENAFSPFFAQFVSSIENGGPITPDQRGRIANYLTLQYLRTPEMRRTIVEMNEKAMTAWVEAELGISLERESLYLKYGEEHAPMLHGQVLFNPNLVRAIGSALSNHIWIVVKNTTAQPFFTSDHPVTRVAHRPEAGDGFAAPGVEITFPLDSRHQLVLYERTHFPEYLPFDNRCITTEDADEAVIHFNTLQVTRSYRWVYCEEERFGLAVKLCEDYPEICDVERDRVDLPRSVIDQFLDVKPKETRQNSPRLARPQMPMTRRTRKRLESHQTNKNHS